MLHEMLHLAHFEETKELAHAEAMLMRVAGNPFMGYADNGGRCALPLP